MSIWHNTRGIANQYFVCKGEKVLFQIPNWLGRFLLQRKLLRTDLKEERMDEGDFYLYSAIFCPAIFAFALLIYVLITSW